MEQDSEELYDSSIDVLTRSGQTVATETYAELGSLGLALLRTTADIASQVEVDKAVALTEVIAHLKYVAELNNTEALALKFFLDPTMDSPDTLARQNAIFAVKSLLTMTSHEQLLSIDTEWLRTIATIFGIQLKEGKIIDTEPISIRGILNNLPYGEKRRALPNQVYTGLNSVLSIQEEEMTHHVVVAPEPVIEDVDSLKVKPILRKHVVRPSTPRVVEPPQDYSDFQVRNLAKAAPYIVENKIEDDSKMDWQEKALCTQTDPEAFFPEKGGSTRNAKKICGGCEVRGECLAFAMSNDERYGIWGGLSERQRRKLKKLTDPLED